MKISLNWLYEHIPLTLSADDLSRHLLELGFEVASRQRLGPGFTGVISAEILAIDKHPNADRLSLCRVTDGASTFSVVCGAKNIAVGQRVPLARIGAVLPGGRRIEPTKIRGQESQGMICSSSELGLSGADNGGILVLDSALTLGRDMAEALGNSDDILEVEITPNRPDCLSHLGLARELSAFFRVPMKLRTAGALKEQGEPPSVKIADPKACPRYQGRLLENIRVAPSPGWLISRLESVGLRAINNVVDVTNFILMDRGQPLHAFDAAKLSGGGVIVRRAAAGESLMALDGKNYALTPDCLVIADSQKPAAIAGIMGGLHSAVVDSTTRVFLESACFDPPAIRKASEILRLRSDSSQRFERGTDFSAVGTAADAAAEMILSLAGPKASCSLARDLDPGREMLARISFTPIQINSLLGSKFPEPEILGALESLSGSPVIKENEKFRLTVPSHRHDLEIPADLAEETGRLLGYGRIESSTPVINMRSSPDLPSLSLAERCRRRLSELGLCETYNYDFLSDKLLARARLSETPQHPFARLKNPLNEDWAVLRPSLLIGLLQNAALNLNREASQVRLFEIGKTYRRQAEEIIETTRVSALLLGPRGTPHWQDRPARSDLYEAKGIAEDILAGIVGLEWSVPRPDSAEIPAASEPLFHPKGFLRVKMPEGPLGCVGLLNPRIARAWELEREGAVIIDLDLDLLAGVDHPRKTFEPYSAFPSSKRDISFFIFTHIPYAEIAETISSCAVSELRKTTLLDVFSGEGVPEGRRSLTARLEFGLNDRTLKDSEVNAAVEKITSALKERFSVALRA